MYKPLLILKYLGKRRIAWVSLIAVMLCTAMVLVVISVMGGWLQMFRASFQGLSGDLVVRTSGLTGFPYYEEMAAELEAEPEFTAAVPLIDTYGLINIENLIQDGVRVVGLPIDRIGEVNAFPESLFLQNPKTSPAKPLEEWRELQAEFAEDRLAAGLDPEVVAAIGEASLAPVEEWAEEREPGQAPSFDLPWPAELYRSKVEDFGGENRRGRGRAPDVTAYPGIIVGTGVLDIRKDEQGEMDRWTGVSPVTGNLAPNPILARLVLLALNPEGGRINLENQKSEFSAWIVDNSRTGVFNADQNSVYVDFGYVQRALKMDASPVYESFDAEGNPVGEPIDIIPARTGQLHIAVADGADLNAARIKAEQIVNSVLARHEGTAMYARNLRVETWEQRYGAFLAAVEKERALVVTLFGFISIVAVFLILCIFYMIVKEKTRDIGIVKSVGATSGGIAAIFLGYGAAIGIVGAGLGLFVGGLIVHFINEIHDLMNTVLGVQIWSAETYLFDTIPNTLDPKEATIIFLAAVVSSIIGAVVPAWRAASLRPVEALRFE